MSDEFRVDSRIIEIVTGDLYEGVVLNSPDEVIKALRVFASGKLKSSGRIKENLGKIESAYAKDASNPKEFLSELESMVLLGLEQKGRFSRLVSEEGYGTDFYESMFSVDRYEYSHDDKNEDRYVLDIRAFHLDQESNIDIAKVMFRPRALSSSKISMLLSPFDGFKFSIDLKDALSGLFFEDSLLSDYAKFISRAYCDDVRFDEEPKLMLDDSGKKYRLSLELSLNPSEPDWAHEECSVSSEGTRLLGTAYAVSEDKKKGYAPELGISVSKQGRPALSRKEASEVIAFRDRISDIIAERHF